MATRDTAQQSLDAPVATIVALSTTRGESSAAPRSERNKMLSFVPVLFAQAVPTGPYGSTTVQFTVETLDRTSHTLDVTYPTGTAAAGRSFPLVSYTHGLGDKGASSYPRLFSDLASWGYVIAAPLSCKDGCLSDCKTNLGDPPCFGDYYKESFKVIEWARSSQVAASLPLNRTSGVAVAGHSMGGQAALLAASDANVSSYGIKAALMHHAYTHIYPAISTVPFLAFTGTEDFTAPPAMADKFFAAATVPQRGLVNSRGANHHEPTTDYRPEMALFSTAWLKVHLDQTPESDGMHWDDLIYGTGSDSLCGGGDGPLAECTLLPATHAAASAAATTVEASFYPDATPMPSPEASPSPSPQPEATPEPARAPVEAVHWTL